MLLGLCTWLDRLPLSRPKRHLARDFSDGVLVAEIVKHFHPRLVDLHNYSPACNTDQKLSNWSLLNRQVFHKLHFCVSEADIRKVVANVPGAIEPILCALREKVEPGTVHAVSPSTADPGPYRVAADQPWVEVSTHTYTGRIQTHGSACQSPFRLSVRGITALHMTRHMTKESRQSPELTVSVYHTGLPDSPDPSSVKTLHNQKSLQMDCSALGCGDPAKGSWEHLARVQQLLEDKEQALAILQQIVQILQMKVVRLEHLVQLKDQRIETLMRPGPEE
ncbi:Sperm flagellar protein 1 [Fukomys damarensis]|uniref:Sperm flagellar protein 1 n=1 Tax=Fukomys damarensis TaxID=885580 RepID=A0A091E6N6_FUKDA|nr:Sperm flagellar protein 1 [Fukomys damarensis]